MSFFSYRQNNTGGSFDTSMGLIVYVEARSAEEADMRAESVGLYFDGRGDCRCCGPRWSNAYGEPDHQTLAEVQADVAEQIDYAIRQSCPISILPADATTLTFIVGMADQIEALPAPLES